MGGLDILDIARAANAKLSWFPASDGFGWGRNASHLPVSQFCGETARSQTSVGEKDCKKWVKMFKKSPEGGGLS
jgi:hypothetical protein